MNATTINQRFLMNLISKDSGIPLQRLESGELTGDDWEKIAATVTKINDIVYKKSQKKKPHNNSTASTHIQ